MAPPRFGRCFPRRSSSFRTRKPAISRCNKPENKWTKRRKPYIDNGKVITEKLNLYECQDDVDGRVQCCDPLNELLGTLHDVPIADPLKDFVPSFSESRDRNNTEKKKKKKKKTVEKKQKKNKQKKKKKKKTTTTTNREVADCAQDVHDRGNQGDDDDDDDGRVASTSFVDVSPPDTRQWMEEDKEESHGANSTEDYQTTTTTELPPDDGVEDIKATGLEPGVSVEEEAVDVDRPKKTRLADDDDDVMEVDWATLKCDDEDDAIEKDEIPFVRHFGTMLDGSSIRRLRDKDKWETHQTTWPVFGPTTLNFPKKEQEQEQEETPSTTMDLRIIRRNDTFETLHVRKQLWKAWTKCKNLASKSGKPKKNLFTDLQRQLFSVMNNYTDLLYCHSKAEDRKAIVATYCLHVANHVLRSRAYVRCHDVVLGKCQELLGIPDDCRDQGLTRPTCLILVPFKSTAKTVVKCLQKLLVADDSKEVMRGKRFASEFRLTKWKTKKMKIGKNMPKDYRETFSGNVDDDFCVGMSLLPHGLMLYEDLHQCDIIVSSPLTLRMLMGGRGDKNRQFDYLSSIEVVVLDQAEVVLMQNWEHVTYIFQKLHCEVTRPHDVNIARVRPWILERWGRHYRQTLIFSSLVCPELNSILSRSCCNYAGVVRVDDIVGIPSVRQVLLPIPQVFHKFQVLSHDVSPEARFVCLTRKILPRFRDANKNRTLVFVPSYFDFVRLRNFLAKREVPFAHICEYDDDEDIAKARSEFARERADMLLYTERAHFYNRFRIRGIQHLVFFQLPLQPRFYGEVCNFVTRLHNPKGEATTCTVLFSRYDYYRLAAVVGCDRAAQMIASDNDDFMLVSGGTN